MDQLEMAAIAWFAVASTSRAGPWRAVRITESVAARLGTPWRNGKRRCSLVLLIEISIQTVDRAHRQDDSEKYGGCGRNNELPDIQFVL